VLTISVLLVALVGIGLWARHYSVRTRLLMVASIFAAILLLSRGG
jgi:hypothetical protein